MRPNHPPDRYSPMQALKKIAVAPLLLALGGCKMVVMNPSGDIAAQQRDLIIIATVLMLLIIVPVIILTLLFAWKYRRSNEAAKYDPDWHHSTRLEIVIWAAPLVIITILGAVTWTSTHLLDPYRPLDRIAPGRAAATKPLKVQVVALDWKWLFIYPELGIATVNELAAPVDTPIDFDLTSSSVMNSFYVPALAGQIYAMPGMRTQLHAVINKPGEYEGFSANYSGAGFSDMRFKFHGLSQADFQQWARDVRGGKGELNRSVYLVLEKPSQKTPVQRFASVDRDLFDAAVNRCVEPGKMCQHDMMRIDAAGGLGMAGVYNVTTLEYDKRVRRGEGGLRAFVAALCAPPKATTASVAR
ncbi:MULTISPECIES: ubiquinol oxidase subunit II [Caulobacter]|uniref:Ubiquinol oxidase subunit 2 n=2 Tax=Caulobacter vibrioides TaxID=155892 RepID=R0ESD8_CAUVI|nr:MULTISPECIES: ubiquinol oxidase subunit II [Caulobacter]ENZ83897.1 cytochrome bo3 quinol oxidase subunit 2 [Caulobacter vibrioides OR37]MBQ1562967.1 ubiquinol oxidase subunit II [Caulobacter sp.]